MTSSKASKVIPQTGFQETFDTLEFLGQGTFGIVKKCRNKKTKEEFAVKIIRTRVLNARIENETQICSQLEHPHIVRLHCTYQDDMQYYMIFDLVTGGELFDDIVKREYYSESEASKCIQQILYAVDYCHDKNIIHRDIKPENLLLKNQDPKADIKLANFGLALKVTDDDPGCHKIAGTLGYFSPEILKKEKYSKPVDIWACGVILYILLVGYPPFWDDDEKVLSSIICEGKYIFYSPEWDSITDEAKSLINRMLHVDCNKRITAREALSHPWIDNREKVASKIHHQETIKGLRKFNARRKLKVAILSTMCTQRLGMLVNEKHKMVSPTQQTEKNVPVPPGNVTIPPLDRSEEKFFKEILAKTTRICEALVMNDTESSEALYARNFTKFEPDLNINFGKTAQVTIVSPNVKKIGMNGACISYSKLVQYINQANSHVTHQSLETRLWENTGGEWKCVHLHSS